MRRLFCLLLLPLLPLPVNAQEMEHGSKTEAPKAGAPAPRPEPDCKRLSTGDTFCRVEQDGVMHWKLQSRFQPDYAVGDRFPVYEHSMLMDLRRHGLPPVDGAWRYYLVHGMIYKVDAQSALVLEVIGPCRRR